jgi:serine/threonine protein kinase
MNLAAGTRLGPYEIQSAIGAGGMGEVYKAKHTRLDRTVAIKVLPEAFAADPERIARFQREAKTLAALNRLHIAAIYGMSSSIARSPDRWTCRRLHALAIAVESTLSKLSSAVSVAAYSR